MANEAGQIRQEELDGEREARRRTALAQIRQYGDPVLRMRAREVEQFDDDLVRLAERMTRLMREANGVGLAGNQVGVLQRIVVIQPGAEEEPVALVNPELVERDGAAGDRRRGLPLAPGRARPGRALVARRRRGEGPAGRETSGSSSTSWPRASSSTSSTTSTAC